LSGQILLNGADYSERPLAEISQIVGTVLQDPERQILGAFVRNEVAFGLENLGISRPEIVRRVDETLEYLGIAHLIDRATFSLSGGETQKVALAGVLAMQPDVLVLDEPLASLDPASVEDALSLIRRLADEGKAVLIIEHRVEDVLAVQPDQVMYMDAGSITYLGDHAGLLQTADYHEVKLPTPIIIERVAKSGTIVDPEPAPAINANGSTLVTFDNVSFNYPDGPPVIKDVNLRINEGDVIAVLGSNGAGKTTLVKHAIGLLKPVSGHVLLGETDSKNMTVAKMAQTVGYVFQSPRHMLFAPTVREELAFGPRNLGHTVEEIETNTIQALAVVNLEDEIDTAPLALSFGQQKRISIASILAMQSSILVMDEPTAGQDFANYMSFMDSVVGLGGDGPYSFAAILFITHDVDLAVTFANRILLVSDGELAADGPPTEVLADFDLLRRCRVIPTSLLEANVAHFEKTGRFMRAEVLAYALKH
jgi:energy-coupling factor transport system ATP-binding protein